MLYFTTALGCCPTRSPEPWVGRLGWQTLMAEAGVSARVEIAQRLERPRVPPPQGIKANLSGERGSEGEHAPLQRAAEALREPLHAS